ncbi:hypothetical protein NFI96_024821 [Prochilodus magdalenae]|nr:hypothetical protein NFI96_024821 [Prochilodus magdalenae]
MEMWFIIITVIIRLLFHRLMVKKSMAAAIVPLEEGFYSINRVYEALSKGDVDPITGQCSNYNYIREQIVEAQQSLEKSEHVAATELTSLDGHIEILTQDEGKLEQEMSDTRRSLENLRAEQISSERSLREYEDAVEQARRNLDSTREVLRSQEERKYNAEVVTGVGAGLLAIPIFGWIAGPIMIATGEEELEQASYAVRAAEEEVRNYESQMEWFKSKVYKYESEIYQVEQGISQKHDEVERIHEEIQRVKEQREMIAEFQQKVRRTVHILSVLSGKISVAESQTRRFILQKPVMKVMEDLMKSAEDIAGNQLLCNEGMLSLINAMKENSGKLAAICDFPSDADDDAY